MIFKDMKLFFFTLCFFIVFGCSQSGNRKYKTTHALPKLPASQVKIDSQNNGEIVTTVDMIKESGVYKIPTEVNGVKMFFIFDTGAGMISMSNTEAAFLYKQGTLTEEDIVGNAKFTDANGDVSDGLVVLLKEVKVGNRVLKNIEASIVPNLQAPLLLGQSALQKFGKVSIDYNKNQITFE